MSGIYRQHCYFCEGRGQAPAWRTGLTHDSICPKCSGSGFADTTVEALAAERDAALARAVKAEARIAAARANGVVQFLYTDECAAEAWADDIALFILHKVIGAESLTLADIAPNLTVPAGWVSFARLWRAGFIEVTGDYVQPTERGAAVMRELLVCVGDVTAEGVTTDA